MKKSALIIGYGSIGRRHASLLKKIANIGKFTSYQIKISQNFKGKKFGTCEKINQIIY